MVDVSTAPSAMSTAIALWLVYGCGLALYAAWAIPHIAAGGSPWWYAAGALVVYAGALVAFTTLWFSLAWVHRARRPEAMQIGAAASLRLYWNELRAIARSGPRMALYRLLRDPPAATAALPVLLVHGVLCNAGALAGLRADLIARGIGPVYTFSYGPPLASIDVFSDQLAARVGIILSETGASRLAIVGHSMGGLVARDYLRRYGGATVDIVMTLGSPHHGSVHAYLFPGSCLEQMRPASRWLAELNGEPLPRGVRFVSLWSWHDSMVAPQTSARLDGAENIELRGIGHNALIGDRQVYALVAAELERATGLSRLRAATSCVTS